MGNNENDILNKFKVNIISWYNFKKLETILLIGNIDRVIVQFLCKKFNKVVILDENISEKDNLYKISNEYKNLSIENQNFLSRNNEKFDYILLMNYFENSSNAEIAEFINKISNCVYDNGKILAIFENKIGVKNFVNKNFSRIFKK